MSKTVIQCHGIWTSAIVTYPLYTYHKRPHCFFHFLEVISLSLYHYIYKKKPTSILFFQFWEMISYILHPTQMLPSAARPSSAVGLLGANQHPRSCGWRAESFWRRATEFRYLTMATWSSLRSRWTMQTNTNVSPQTPQAKERVLLQHWQFWVLFPTPMSRLNF